MSCDLYRFYDSDDRLLYVGISLHAATRASQHRSEKAWWPNVVRMDVERLPDRQAAQAAELAAIRGEKPLHNVVGNNYCSRAPRPRGLVVGSVHAFALDVWVSDVRRWRCPVGLITDVIGPTRDLPHPAYRIDLYSWPTMTFGYMDTTIGGECIKRTLEASSHQEDVEIFHMDPLADFQTAWAQRPAP